VSTDLFGQRLAAFPSLVPGTAQGYRGRSATGVDILVPGEKSAPRTRVSPFGATVAIAMDTVQGTGVFDVPGSRPRGRPV